MTAKSPHLSFSIVVETENLGMAGLDDLKKCLVSLEEQTYPIHKAAEVLLVVGSHLSQEAAAELKSRFPWVVFHSAGRSLGYTEAKVVGAQLATSEIVVFADSDLRYEETWLENLLNVFVIHPEAVVAAGDTRLEIKDAYRMALNLTWMFAPKSNLKQAEPTDDFRLNNFAMRRSNMLKVPFPNNYPLYRRNVPVWRQRVIKRGFRIYRAPSARGYHAPPETFLDWWYRMLIFGRDFVAKEDFTFSDNEETIEKRNILGRFISFLSWPLIRIKRFVKGSYTLIREDIGYLKCIILAIPYCLAATLLSTLGAAITCFNRDYLLERINERERI